MLKLPPLVVTLATLALGLVALYTSADLYQLSAAANREPQDPYLAGMQDARFGALAAAVPTGATLGYVSDLGPETTAGGAMYFTAQYALAPRLLVRLEKTSAVQVVGNFTSRLTWPR